MEQNNRKFPRAKYPCQLTAWKEGGGGEVIMANTVNIGAGGICIMMNQKIMAGSKVGLRIDFTNPKVVFKCTGVVSRCRPITDKSFEVGITFKGLSEFNQIFLENKVKDLMTWTSKSNPL